MSDNYCLRKARKQHVCAERSYHTMQPGDLYLYGCCPPWHDCGVKGKFWHVKVCLRCADEFGMLTAETRKRVDEWLKADIIDEVNS